MPFSFVSVTKGARAVVFTAVHGMLRMDWTDVHYRQLARLISKHTWLYTEMNVDSTLLHNPNLDRCDAVPADVRVLR